MKNQNEPPNERGYPAAGTSARTCCSAFALREAPVRAETQSLREPALSRALLSDGTHPKAETAERDIESRSDRGFHDITRHFCDHLLRNEDSFVEVLPDEFEAVRWDARARARSDR